MRMSCNGCRVLRKGCSEECSIRPCLQWIKSPDQQANATLFLAKFYGRAGLLNLLHTGPLHLRPAIFRSLLYEACGRIVNPVHGSVGLLWSGNWHLCQSAVDAVLRGAPIDAASADLLPPSFDIRHVPRGKTASSARKRSQHLDLDGVCAPPVASANSSASSDGEAVELDLTLGFDRGAAVEAAIPEAEEGVDLGLELAA